MDLNLLATFNSFLPQPAHLLDVGRKTTPELSDETTWLTAHGHQTEKVDSNKDLRMLTLRRESYDGIWCHEAVHRLHTKVTILSKIPQKLLEIIP